MSDGNGNGNGEIRFRFLTIDQAQKGFAQLHDRVCCDKGRVLIQDGDKTCVLISKEELEALEQALEILSNTSDVQKMARQIAAMTHEAAKAPPVVGAGMRGAN
jgi:PHD/YefM family antitoxin component YafN of YafNO toxin-antitoxin module